MAKRGRKAKNKETKQQERFESLGGEWCDAMKGKENEEIKVEIGKVATNSFTLAMARKQDRHLAELKEQVKQADAGYKEGIKTNDIRIEFMIMLLRDRGAVIPSIEELMGRLEHEAAEGDTNE